jgi:hypothetical protein
MRSNRQEPGDRLEVVIWLPLMVLIARANFRLAK